MLPVMLMYARPTLNALGFTTFPSASVISGSTWYV